MADALTNHSYEVRRPVRLCVPAEANGATKPLPAAYLLCYRVRRAAGEPSDGPLAEPIYTSSALDDGRFDSARPDGALRSERWRLPCDTLPPCVPISAARTPIAPTRPSSSIRYTSCVRARPSSSMRRMPISTRSRPTASPAATGDSRGSSRRMATSSCSRKGPSKSLLPHTDAAVLVIANPDLPDVEAVPAEEVPVIADWVRQGGSLLLSIDHEPYGRVGAAARRLRPRSPPGRRRELSTRSPASAAIYRHPRSRPAPGPTPPSTR